MKVRLRGGRERLVWAQDQKAGTVTLFEDPGDVEFVVKDTTFDVLRIDRVESEIGEVTRTPVYDDSP